MARQCWPDGTPYTGGHWIYRGQRYALYLRDRLRCVYCDCDALVAYQERGGFTLDHVCPVGHGGARLDPCNLVTACMSCNQRKGEARPPDVEARRRARNATRRKVPSTRDGLALFKESRGPLGLARAALRRELLDPVSIHYFRPELPFDEPPQDPPDDDIPW